MRPHNSNLGRPCRSAVTACLAVLTMLVVCGSALGASRGDLDPTFSDDGRVTTPAVGDASLAPHVDVASQADGKIVVAGSIDPDGFAGDLVSDFYVARYLADGSPDTTFSGDGIQTVDFDGGNDQASSVDIAPDGKIVVAGSTRGDDFSDVAVARLNTDGSPDGSFAGDGRQTFDYGATYNTANAVTVLGDGRIVAGGTATTTEPQYDFGLARLAENGELDMSFAGDGTQTTDFAGREDHIEDLVIEDGKVIAAGRTDPGGFVWDFAVARYNEDGSLDNSFSGDGRQSTDFGTEEEPRSDTAYGIAVQEDGKIVVSGTSGVDPSFDWIFAVARYEPDGDLDPDFAAGGKQTFDFDGPLVPPDVSGYLSFGDAGVAIQADGTIVIAGTSLTYDDAFNESSDIAVGALTPDGSLDPGFSGDGKATATFPNARSDATGMELTADGRIIVAGWAVGAAGSSDLALARLYGNEPPAYTLTVAPTGSGTGAVSGPGINCPGDCSETYPEATQVTLNATASAGSAFSGWSGDCSGAGGCSVQMTADRNTTASFAAVPPATVQPPSTPSPSRTACTRARSALKASRKRVHLNSKRVTRAKRRLKAARRVDKRVPAARKSVRTAQTKLKKAQNRRMKAQRQVAREC